MKHNKFNAKVVNKMQIKLPSLSVNEGMARAAAAAFVSQLDPTATELADIKCAVSEAVTNCIVHGYRDCLGMIRMTVKLCEGRIVRIEIADKGCGIADVKQARQPLFTTDAAGERQRNFRKNCVKTSLITMISFLSSNRFQNSAVWKAFSNSCRAADSFQVQWQALTPNTSNAWKRSSFQ